MTTPVSSRSSVIAVSPKLEPFLGAARRQAPEAVVDAAGEEDGAVGALEEDHRARVEDGLGADLLPQPPQI